ncbi:transporter, auxin efflux carrier (AEC) family protein [Fusobacterium nucleatum subsp. nucleatum ATCC 23726]|uniref:Transporter, auxin efflux carrier (AEC) family protein n=3 Tax=Fusobacterium TaxID=848 RepID=D5RAN0_FUSN2|nr:AEC family transporter [Fusobacterium nucleatum subsp. nucleatum ATCC 23726]EFG96123.1 transporter, auxin efflux carrier (AEC) family protein [Fusobacterium nucleatum subsp. nucleatum ATCC 23726]
MGDMENFLLAFNVVFPIFLIMMLGVILKRKNMVDEKSLNVMNSLIFRLFMPTLLFFNIYNMGDLSTLSFDNLKLLAYAFISILIVLLLAWLIYMPNVKDRKKLSVLIQGVYRGNFVLFGLAIADSLYGKESLGTVSLLTAIVIPTFNVIAVILLEYYSGNEVNKIKLIKQVFKNPLIIATLTAIVFLVLKINIPKPVYKAIGDISKIATPLAFLVLGAGLKFGNILKNLKYLISVNILRLIGNPLITVGLGKLLGFQGIELVALLSMSACPTAVVSYTMAKEMNADGDLAGEIVATTSMLSIFTIFCWVLMLKNLEWI